MENKYNLGTDPEIEKKIQIERANRLKNPVKDPPCDVTYSEDVTRFLKKRS